MYSTLSRDVHVAMVRPPPPVLTWCTLHHMYHRHGSQGHMVLRVHTRPPSPPTLGDLTLCGHSRPLDPSVRLVFVNWINISSPNPKYIITCCIFSVLVNEWKQVSTYGYCTLWSRIMIESPEWLTSYSKYEEANDSIKKMAKWNGVSSPCFRLRIVDEEYESELKKDAAMKVPVKDIFADPKLRIHFLIANFLW